MPMARLMIVAIALALFGCASDAMRGYVGKSVTAAYIDHGTPENVFDLPDGRRAFQFRWGGGAGIVPGYANSTVSPTGLGGFRVTTTGVPATYVESAGCLVTLIARPNGNDFLIEEYRIPKRLVC